MIVQAKQTPREEGSVGTNSIGAKRFIRRRGSRVRSLSRATVIRLRSGTVVRANGARRSAFSMWRSGKK